MTRFFVYGGCVTRDVFNPEYNINNNLIVSEYVARYSLAKLWSPEVNIIINKDNVTSKFQQNILKMEANNVLLDLVENTEFDYLIMDVMFFRYSIISYLDTYLTCSSELLKAGCLRRKSEVYTYLDQLYWDFFESGLEIFIRFLRKRGLLDKLLINKVFLATEYSDGTPIENIQTVNLQNKILCGIYKKIKEKVKDEAVFIEYPIDLFVASKSHRWGKAPMHYTDNLYKHLFNQLSLL